MTLKHLYILNGAFNCVVASECNETLVINIQYILYIKICNKSTHLFSGTSKFYLEMTFVRTFTVI